MRRLLPALLLIWVLAGLAALAQAGLMLWGQVQDNRAIRSLAAGTDLPLRAGADPRAHEARALYLAWRGRIPEAEAQAGGLDRASPLLQAEFHYAIGNARMRRAFDQLEANRIDDATTEVNLAKTAYRQALDALPGHYDSKVNLDLAMRLVRDLPREGNGEEDPEVQPQRLWTDLPGLPRGAP
ncbi:hypothetical protein GL279_06770 [Paracoccus limosus]|uniref:MxaK protein n=1 Tax=Paracoccus limosus TaxID=913252 RepID=A0A844H0D8_9RHOB|nr:hypothetical protein [Paracoccus limosus]MTH34302.1 hypothetical protein [Paracoccus limosus]